MGVHAGATPAKEAFLKTDKVFLIGESWLAFRNMRTRGNVQKGLEDLGFIVQNFATNGVTLKNFWNKEYMSWEKWSKVQKQDAMVISVGFNQISEADMSAEDELEVDIIVQQAINQSNNVIVVVPNQPSPDYFSVRAKWYIEHERDNLNEPDVAANALKRQQLYASRFQKLVKLYRTMLNCHGSFQIVEMQKVLTSADICEDGCHLNPPGADKAANGIAEALTGEHLNTKFAEKLAKVNAQALRVKTDAFRFKTFTFACKAVLAIVAFRLLRSLRRRILHK